MIYVVSDSSDVADGNTNSGNLSLREAIDLANANNGDDEIAFAQNIDYIALNEGLQTITDNLAIVGGGNVTIDANVDGDANPDTSSITGPPVDHRVFTVNEGPFNPPTDPDNASAFAIDGLTITGGVSSYGGGVAVFEGAQLTITNSTIRDNAAQGLDAGAGGVYGNGNVIITDSIVTGNYSEGVAGGGGVLAGGNVTVLRSDISSNESDGSRYGSAGGGIAARGNIRIESSSILDNIVASGGGGAGGGVFSQSDIVIIGSTIDGNRVSGGAGVSGGGVSGDNVTVTRSTISNNIAGMGGARYSSYTVEGGGISARESVFLEASTVSGNLVRNSYSPAHTLGGGISADYVRATGSTVTGNSATSTFTNSSGYYQPTDYSISGGGIFAGSTRLVNTIVAGNFLTALAPAPVVVSEFDVSGSLNSDGVSLVGGDGREVFASTVEAIPGVFAGVLADNGGPTRTVAILVGGLADGTGNPATATPLDQRGVARTGPDSPDVGAFEAVAGGSMIRGTSGPDFLVGTPGDDTLLGFGGNDTLRGGRGTDLINGGGGFDLVDYSVNTTGVVVSLPNQRVTFPGTGEPPETLVSIEAARGGSGNDRLIGNGAANLLIGANGNDTLTGGDGADTLDGGGGADALAGGTGNDIYITTGGDTITEGPGAGIDVVRSSVTHTLGANLENLTLTGTAAINGWGNGLANVLIGNTGINSLNGGLGSDRLIGGASADTFIFNTTLGAGNIDRLPEFSVPHDTIRLENAIFTGLAAGALTVAAFARNASGAAADASDRVIYETDTGALFFDRDGLAGAARIQFATLDAGLGATHADFFVI